MGNRKQPFGYQIKNGRVTLHAVEADLVVTIFERYTNGESYKSLARWLQTQPVPYGTGKPWNMNTVARILGDERYIGANGYTAILSREKFDRAAAKRETNAGICRITETQKTLRRLSGRRLTAAEERQALESFAHLIQHPETVQPVQMESTSENDAAELRQTLDGLMQHQPLPEEDAQRCALQLAAAEYERLGDSEYESERIRNIFEKAMSDSPADAALLRETVSAIRICRGGEVEIQLKNQQIIGGGKRNETGNHQESERP